MQHGILYRPVKGKIYGNLLDHKQTLGYTGHWAVLSERRSNTVNVCARMRVCVCVNLYVRREGESGARACKRTLAPWESLVFLHLLFHTVTCSDLTRRDLDVDRVRFISPPRARQACKRRARACARLTDDRYLGSVVWLSTETLPRGASSHARVDRSDRLSLMENATCSIR